MPMTFDAALKGDGLGVFSRLLGGRRARTRRLLDARGIRIPNSLPPIESVARSRSDDELIRRAACLYAVGRRAFGSSREDVESVLVNRALIDDMAPSELAYVKSDAADTAFGECSIEGLWVALWALGIYPRLDLLAPVCPDDLVDYCPKLSRSSGMQDFAQSAQVRSDSELADALDLAYCLDWAVVDGQIEGQASIPVRAAESGCRRRVLEWIFDDSVWDEVSLDT